MLSRRQDRFDETGAGAGGAPGQRNDLPPYQPPPGTDPNPVYRPFFILDPGGSADSIDWWALAVAYARAFGVPMATAEQRVGAFRTALIKAEQNAAAHGMPGAVDVPNWRPPSATAPGGPAPQPLPSGPGTFSPPPGVSVAPMPVPPSPPVVDSGGYSIYDGGTGLTLPPGAPSGAQAVSFLQSLTPAQLLIGAAALFFLLRR